MNLELDIDNLVLYGFPISDRDRIARALHRELERLFIEEGVPLLIEARVDMAYLDNGSFDVTPNSSPESVGIQMARALYGGFK